MPNLLLEMALNGLLEESESWSCAGRIPRLASLAQNEYASYKKWLLTEGLKCAQAEYDSRMSKLERAA